LSATFIVSLMAGMRYASPLLKVTYRISAVWLGVLNFCLFAALGCWIANAVSTLFGLELGRRVIAAMFYGVAVLASGYGLLNAAWLRVTRVSVRLPHLPLAWQGREVVLMSDLHLGNVRGAGFMRRVARKVMSLTPYAVFVSGDLFDGPKADYDRLVEPCRELSAPAGVYFVTGNHEEFTDRGKYIAAIQRAGLRVLNNEKVTVEGLQIVGVHDREAGEPERLRKILQDAALDRRQASILLAHQPAHLSIPEEAGISLQVSGHTHKGQFWPWCWIIYKVHGPFAYGLNRAGNLLVLTSSGAGTWGPPMRVGTKSEIVLIRLEAADAPA
jgi:predicted MPP superfamily phosphohydrolase